MASEKAVELNEALMRLRAAVGTERERVAAECMRLIAAASVRPVRR
jgi:hypothetical protein